MRKAPRGDDDDVRAAGKDGVRIGEAVEAKRDAHPYALFVSPIDDRHHLARSFGPRREPHLAARGVGGLVHGDVMASCGRHARGLEPAGAGADNQEPSPRGGRRNLVRDRQLASRRRVVNAVRLAALVDAVEAVVGPHAGANTFFAPLDDLADQVRIRQVRPRHADHVQLAARNGVTRGRHVRNPRGVKDGEAGRGPDPAREVEMGGAAHALHGYDIGEAGIRVDMPADHVQEVHHRAVPEHARDLESFLFRQSSPQPFVRGVAHADDEVGADPPAYLGQDVHRQANTVPQVAAIRPLEGVGQR